jgi:hypothetical protein
VKQVAMNVEVAGNPVEDLVGKNNPHHDITEILLKVALNTIKQNKQN